MIVYSDNKNVEATGVKSDYSFSIQDPAIVMQTLAGLYSNERRIVVQEYISNARDAHREVGKDDVPVQVTLPNQLSHELIIRDFGPGLSPKRIEEVFVVFGASTKRHSDGETGGFGIGAKCAFAYTSGFTVITWHDGMQRSYSLYKADNGIPRMSLLDERKSDKETGTEIRVPIDQSDINVIQSDLRHVCRFWDVRPEVLNNDDFDWDDNVRVDATGKDWKLVKIKNRYSYSFSASGTPKVLLDGIPYPINEEVFDSLPKGTRNMARVNLYLEFNTGDIRPAPSRESLQYNEAARKMIVDRIVQCHNEFTSQVNAEMKKCKTLIEALKTWDKLSHGINKHDVVLSVKWKNVEINNFGVELPNGTVCNEYSYKAKTYNWEGRICSEKSTTRYLSYSGDKNLVLLDTENSSRPMASRLKTAFDKNPDVENIIVLRFSDNAKRYLKSKKVWKILGAKSLQTFEKKKRVKNQSGKSTTNRVVTKVYEFLRNSYTKSDCWGRSDIDIKNDNFYYVEYHRSEALGFDSYDLHQLKKIFDINIYGIPSRYLDKVEKNNNAIHLMDHVNEYFEKNVRNYKLPKEFLEHVKGDDYDINSPVIRSMKNHYWVNLSNVISRFNKLVTANFDTSHVLRKWVEAYTAINCYSTPEEVDNNMFLARLVNRANRSKVDFKVKDFEKDIEAYEPEIKKYHDDVIKRYPLLIPSLEVHTLNHSEAAKDIVEYIKMKDKKNA